MVNSLKILLDSIKQIKVHMDPKRIFQYPEKFNMCVHYDDIIDAIKPWGTVEAILLSPGILGLNHLFIARFKEPIFITGSQGKGVRTDSYGGVNDTPFFMRGMHRDGLSIHNVILSPNKIAFDITNLIVDPENTMIGGFSGFHSGALLSSLKLVPDERLRPYVNKPWSENLREEIEGMLTQSEKAARLLEWITASGNAFLKRGISVTPLVGNTHEILMGDIPTADIISNYEENNWVIIHSSLVS